MGQEWVNNKNIVYHKKDGLEFIQFRNFLKYESLVTHCFTTRLGGVSSGECTSLNLGFGRKDTKENIMENYRRVADTLGIDYRNMVFSNQVHENRIRTVDQKDRGKGIVKKSDIIGYDGLITDKKEVALVTFYADCVPVLFLDPEKKVIASVHSGWRGTVKEIAGKTLKTLTDTFGCKIDNIEAAIGPSIGSCCFEVGSEVYDEFRHHFHWVDPYCTKLSEEKWKLDLQGIIARTLINLGFGEDKICNSGICTKCNRDIFFSFRGDLGKTGNQAAIMQLKG